MQTPQIKTLHKQLQKTYMAFQMKTTKSTRAQNHTCMKMVIRRCSKTHRLRQRPVLKVSLRSMLKREEDRRRSLLMDSIEESKGCSLKLHPLFKMMIKRIIQSNTNLNLILIKALRFLVLKKNLKFKKKVSNKLKMKKTKLNCRKR